MTEPNTQSAEARARIAEYRLMLIRDYVTEMLGASQMMRPVSLVLQKILSLLDAEVHT